MYHYYGLCPCSHANATHAQVVLQPHVGSATLQTRIAMGQLVVDNVDAYYANKPLLTPVPAV